MHCRTIWCVVVLFMSVAVANAFLNVSFKDDKCQTSDVVFLVDSSQSISYKSFTKVRDYIAEAVVRIPTKPTRYAGAIFNELVVADWALNQFKNPTDLIAYLNSLHYDIGVTRLEIGLQKAQSILTGPQANKDACKEVILFTDGWTMDEQATQRAVSSLKQAVAGVSLSVVGVPGVKGGHPSVNNEFLATISDNPIYVM